MQPICRPISKGTSNLLPISNLYDFVLYARNRARNVHNINVILEFLDCWLLAGDRWKITLILWLELLLEVVTIASRDTGQDITTKYLGRYLPNLP